MTLFQEEQEYITSRIYTTLALHGLFLTLLPEVPQFKKY